MVQVIFFLKIGILYKSKHVFKIASLHWKKYIHKITEKVLAAHYTQHYPLILRTFLLTL